MRINLPEKMSALIRVALDDLERVEKSSDYVIDMMEWHTPYNNGYTQHRGKCAVCFAGAIMTRVLDKNVEYDFGDFDPSTNDKFTMLNALRNGHVDIAYSVQNSIPYHYLTEQALAQKNIKTKYAIHAYEESPTEFKRDMRELADILEKADL